jgi:hypothetical protein
VESKCRRLSCVHPNICPLLNTSHGPLKSLMKNVRAQKGIRRTFVASGIRMDLAQLDQEYLEDLSAHHVGGHLKVAPEHASDHVLEMMKKPSIENFTGFAKGFERASKKANKEQYLVPYFISSHPGSSLDSMIELAVYLKRNGYKPDQVQDFIPAPFDIATCMYYTGKDPFTKKPVEVAKKLNDRKLQKALLQFFKPENYFEVREALERTGRHDLIGNGCDALIGHQPPREALQQRMARARRDVKDMHHRIPTPAKTPAATAPAAPPKNAKSAPPTKISKKVLSTFLLIRMGELSGRRPGRLYRLYFLGLSLACSFSAASTAKGLLANFCLGSFAFPSWP